MAMITISTSQMDGRAIRRAQREGPLLVTAWRDPVAIIVPLRTKAQVEAAQNGSLDVVLVTGDARLAEITECDVGDIPVLDEHSVNDDAPF